MSTCLFAVHSGRSDEFNDGLPFQTLHAGLKKENNISTAKLQFH